MQKTFPPSTVWPMKERIPGESSHCWNKRLISFVKFKSAQIIRNEEVQGKCKVIPSALRVSVLFISKRLQVPSCMSTDDTRCGQNQRKEIMGVNVNDCEK